MVKEERRIYYLFSPFLRIFHWIMAVSILVMFVSGLLITKPVYINALEPTYTLFLVDVTRSVHFLAAFVFCASLILRVYGYIINRGDRLFPRVLEGHFYSETVDVALHYMLLKKSHAPFLRNPLARMSYAGLYVMAAIEIVTGFAMYNMSDPNTIGGFLFGWVNTVLGGEYMTHVVHHYCAWGIMLFVIGHIYMAIRADFMEGEGEISSMFNGTKLLEHEPKDACEVEPPKTK